MFVCDDCDDYEVTGSATVSQTRWFGFFLLLFFCLFVVFVYFLLFVCLFVCLFDCEMMLMKLPAQPL